MKRLMLVIVGLMFLGVSAFAASISYYWDAAVPDAKQAMPEGYHFYVCSDSGLATCQMHDAASALTYTVDLASGSYWLYAVGYIHEITGTDANGPYSSGAIIESAKSNVVITKVQVPPGNPSNVKIR